MSAGTPIRLAWTRISEIGMRASNEDSLGDAVAGPLHCFIVSDGAGGHQAGEVASRIVVDSMLEQFQRAPAFGSAALNGLAGHAITSVAKNKQLQPRHHDMSATLAALLIDGAKAQAVWAHLGDSRIYLFRDGRVHSVSKDHSLTQQLIDAGYAKAEQLRVHPQRNILFAAVGAEGETPVAVIEAPVDLLPGDALLLCSDGLWEWVHETDMERTLAASSSTEQWLAAMCRIADAGVAAAAKVRDNYTAYAIGVQKGSA